jgi:CheY-like chemotaxis protein
MNRSLSILVIHSSPTVGQLLANTLQNQGHQVQCFLDPVIALQALFQTKTVPLPDLLYIHITSTAQLTGYEVLRLLRTHGPQIPLVVICPSADALLQLKAYLTGASFFLGEPLRLQQVVAVAQYIARRSDPHQ